MSPTSLRIAFAGLASTMLLALLVVLCPHAHAQTFTVLHNFTAGADGATPTSGVTMDSFGNLYGTAQEGGMSGACLREGCGTVYKLTHRGTGWIFSPLYSFTGGADGAFPNANVILGPNGTLYSTTFGGGAGYGSNGAGVVFNLHPPAHITGRVFGPWTETVLHTFARGEDGANPAGNLLFDAAGDIYGTASCGTGGCGGTVFKLMPSGGGWEESILYGFTLGSDEYYPYGGVISDSAGNLYGVTVSGAMSDGSVFQLTPSESGWSKNVLYNFQSLSEGAFPVGGLIFDRSGNLYGTTGGDGPQGGGTVFELSPSNGMWAFTLLYSFYCSGTQCSLPGPQSSLFMDSSSNILGTTTGGGGHGYGSVFKLTPRANGWTYTSLHDFTGGSDGAFAYGGVIEDADGNLFGTTAEGGAYGFGTVWRITP